MNGESHFKKLSVVVSLSREWPANQVGGLRLQIGYPDSKGMVQWKSATRFQDKNKELSKTPALAAWTEAIPERVYVFDFTYHHQLDSNQQKIHAKVTLPAGAVKEGSDGENTMMQLFDVHTQPDGEANIGPLVLKWMTVPMQ